MVVFVDYDHEPLGRPPFPNAPDTFSHQYVEPGKPVFSKKRMRLDSEPLLHSADIPASDDSVAATSLNNPGVLSEQQFPNRNAFSAALCCYPIAKEIARSIDLNTLHALSGTCRQFYANLAPYGHQLAKHTLRCENEYIETLSDMLRSDTVIPDSVKSVIRLLSQGAMNSGLLTSGKVSKCARDMVAECHGCSKIVCRNCTAKPPNNSTLKNRVRRLCKTCRTAPLNELLSSPLHVNAMPVVGSSKDVSPQLPQDFCTCERAAWLCYQCGQRLRRNDTTYRRAWTWRTRYSRYLDGGLGTGIGEGYQGVKCGRGEKCLAAQAIELEVECGADESLSSSPSEHGYHHGHRNEQHSHIGSPSPRNEAGEHREEEEPGYFRQEIIGIGGVVKQKSKKRVMVGACVVEHENERETGRWLTREEDGLHRSWCGWCWKVIPAQYELQRFS